MLQIKQVVPGSSAARLGLRAGQFIVSVNGEKIHDAIDFQFCAADHFLTLAIQNKDGGRRSLKVHKDPDDTLGLEFEPLRIKRCRNKCVFCFVDQMPPGCRKTLYVKDDDFRASFLYGNFITLGSLAESDWERIFRQRLSPLYISVHTTDPGLRAFLLRNKKAPPILENLKRLASGGIRAHTQIVLCPGINDGEHLVKTISDLAELHPAVSSIAVVPAGMTAQRKNLYPLGTFSPGEARAVIDLIHPFRKRFKKRYGTALVFPSDEFFIKARAPIPPASFYEDFPQIENGVGMVAAFMREVLSTRLPLATERVSATVITGVSFSAILTAVLKRLKSIKGVRIKQVTVKNGFFGPSVTVAGLLTGRDILHALKGKQPGDMLLIPATLLKEDEDIFLDGMSLGHLEQRLGTRIFKVDGFRDLWEKLNEGGKM